MRGNDCAPSFPSHPPPAPLALHYSVIIYPQALEKGVAINSRVMLALLLSFSFSSEGERGNDQSSIPPLAQHANYLLPPETRGAIIIGCLPLTLSAALAFPPPEFCEIRQF